MAYKKNYSLFMTLLGKQLLATALCLILSVIVLISFGNRYGRTVSQFCTCAIYYALIYTAAQVYGEKDRNAVICGRKKKNLLSGLINGLFVNGINILYSMGLIIFKIIGKEPGIYFVIYRFIINPFYMPINLTLMQTSLSIIEIPLQNIIISVSLTLLMPIVAMLGYIIGYGQSSVKELIMFKTAPADNA